MIRIPFTLPFGLTVPRLLLFIVGKVFLITALGATVFWLLKASGNEMFVPFGLSTFRALNWPMSDMVLTLCCFFSAWHGVKGTAQAQQAQIVGGAAFVVQGLFGFYIDLSQDTRGQFGVEDSELQPVFLNVWFVGWGCFAIWMGTLGLAVLSKLIVANTPAETL